MQLLATGPDDPKPSADAYQSDAARFFYKAVDQSSEAPLGVRKCQTEKTRGKTQVSDRRNA